MPQFAPGIPSRAEYGDLSKIPVGKLLDIFLQQHKARRAGEHQDIRVGSPELGLYSWASRKGLPSPGQKHLGVLQPLHSYGYGGFSGRIEKGYGAGEVKLQEAGKVLVTKSSPDEIHFTMASRRDPQRFVLIRPKNNKNDKHWLLLNTTPTQPPPYPKDKFSLVSKEQAEQIIKNLKPGSELQPKIDGASALYRLGRGHLEAMSFRTTSENRPITYTEKIFGGRPELNLPKPLVGSVLRGEVYGTRDGRAIPPQELGGILNASIAKSLDKQRSGGVELKNLVFDILQRGRKPVSTSMAYPDRLRMLEEVLPHLPPGKFHLPERATDSSAATKLWERIVAGEHPLTLEGAIIRQPGQKPMKAKIREETDAYVRGIFPGEGRLKDQAAGGFTYSLTPKGPILGRVGTGLSDELRRQMHADPHAYLGQIARVTSQGKFPASGALRAPALIGLHLG